MLKNEPLLWFPVCGKYGDLWFPLESTEARWNPNPRLQRTLEVHHLSQDMHRNSPSPVRFFWAPQPTLRHWYEKFVLNHPRLLRLWILFYFFLIFINYFRAWKVESSKSALELHPLPCQLRVFSLHCRGLRASSTADARKVLPSSDGYNWRCSWYPSCKCVGDVT